MKGEVRPDLSIVIATRDTRDLLDACLQSIRRATAGLEVEVVVVDNGSTDGTRELLDRHPEVVVVRNADNRGFAEANNQGLRETRGRYLMLLNSDTEVDPASLRTLVEFMDRHPEVGACGPQLRFPDGSIQRSCFSFETPLRVAADMLGLGRLLPGTRLENLNTRFDHATTRPVDWMIGAALLVRRETMDAIGMLDEALRLHCNDSDWGLRIRQAGYPSMYVAEALVVHHSGATFRVERARDDVDAEMLRNLFFYYRKHFGVMGLTWVRFWMVIGYGAREAIARVRGRREFPGHGTHGETPRQRRLRAALSGKP